MADDQPFLFAEGKSAGATAGEQAPPVAALPDDLTSKTSLTAAISSFYGYMVRQGFSDNTIKAFQADLRLFTHYAAGNQPVGEVSQSDLNSFLTWMRVERGVPCSPKTFARRLTTLKVFFGWLADSGAIPTDPAAPLVHEHPSTPLPDLVYDEHINALLTTARDLLWASKPDARPYLLVTLVLQTGIKKSECAGIKLEHIDLSNPQAPVLYVRYADPRRTLKERKLNLGPGFVAAYKQYLREYKPKEYLFECTPRNLEYVLTDLARLARVPGGVSFEQLRWTSAVRDFRKGMPAETLRQKMGLSEISWRETLPKIQRLARPAL